MSQEEKRRAHERIIASAARLARQEGIEGASVADVMKDAGMTHGGFYKHFASKDDMLAAALDRAFAESAERFRSPSAPDDATDASRFCDYYLSDGHVASPGIGCPIAALSGDIARSGAMLKARFGAGARRLASLLARGMKGSEPARRARALRQLAMMAGAIMIARASDPDTAQEVLAACRDRSP